MIVFSIAFGKPYVDSLLNRCLPSLFSKSRFNPAGIEPLRLVIFTNNETLPTVAAAAKDLKDQYGFAAVQVSNCASGESPKQTSMWLLNRAITRCLDAGESFMFAVPDLVYAAGTIERAYTLYKLTGKVVSLFNGRVKQGFPDTSYLAAAETPAVLLNFFYAYRDRMWQAHTTTDLNQIAGHVPGHMIHCRGPKLLIFGSTPNPFMGRFVPADKLTLNAGMVAWDHQWADSLWLNNRMIVQTDLNSGFSIEPSPKIFRESQLVPLDLPADELQSYKFGAVRTVCFTGSLS